MDISKFADNLVILTEGMRRIPIGHEMDKRLALIEAYIEVLTEIIPEETEEVSEEVSEDSGEDD